MPECSINIESVEVTPCDETSNTYELIVAITHSNGAGDINILGQTFTPLETAGTENFTLVNLPANGDADIDVIAYFVDNEACTDTEAAAFSAPEACAETPECSININAVGASDCNETNNTYELEVDVSYENSIGNININGQVFETAAASGSEIFILTDLTADGETEIDVIAYFEEEASCSTLLQMAYNAPEMCNDGPICEIVITSVETSECDPESNTYELTVGLAYDNGAGDLIINGTTFTLDSPSGTGFFTIPDLPALGLTDLDVLAFFADNEDCLVLEESAFDAPENCTAPGECTLNIVSVAVNNCNADNNTYDLNVELAYTNNISAAEIEINEQLFEVDGSGLEIFTLTNLAADGTENITVSAFFAANDSCSALLENAYDAPLDCTCAADAGSINISSNFVCWGDEITFFTEDFLLGDPTAGYVGIGVSPVSDALYPPSCYALYEGDEVVYMNEESVDLPKNIELYAYSFIGVGEAFNYDVFCFDFSAASAPFVLLQPLTINGSNLPNVINNGNGTSTVLMQLSGGLPAFDDNEQYTVTTYGTNYTGNNTVADNTTLNFQVLDSLAWVVTITDASDCIATVNGQAMFGGEMVDLNNTILNFDEDAGTVTIVYEGEEITLDTEPLAINVGINDDLNTPLIAAKAYPNPASTHLTLQYVLPKPDDVQIQLYNATGQIVQTHQQANLAAGAHTTTIEVADLATGIYFYVLQSNGKQFTERLIISQ